MRLRLIAAGIILISANAYANADLGQQLSICAAKTDKLERLMCYDELAAHAKPSAHIMAADSARDATAENIIAAAPAVAMTQVVGVDDFGLIQKTEGKVDKIYSEVAAIKEGPYGELVITFTNGQVWKQSSPERYNVKKGERVFIKAGALSSFLLGGDDHNATTRVRRLK
jgi:mannose-6-phosphate isomerase class I